MSSFLQSKDWFDFQRSLGRPVFEYDEEGIKAGIIKLLLPFKKSYLYIPHGPEIDPVRSSPPPGSSGPRSAGETSNGVDFNSMAGGLKNPVNNFIMWLQELAKKENAIFIKAEPVSDSVAQTLADIPPAGGFKKSKKEIQPSKTVVLDLSKSENELLDAMHHKTRYNIKVAEKNGITVGESDDFESFWKLMKKTSKRDKFSSHPKNYYQNLLNFFREGKEIISRLNLAYYKDQAVAGLILLTYKDTAFYLHGASDYDYRQYMAPYKLHWEIIKSLKFKNLKFYDLWGVDSKKWPGVTRFKLGWGGQVVEHSGSFDLSVSRFWCLAYKIARKLKPV